MVNKIKVFVQGLLGYKKKTDDELIRKYADRAIQKYKTTLRKLAHE